MTTFEMAAHNLALLKMQIGLNDGLYTDATDPEKLIADYSYFYDNFYDALEPKGER